MASVGTCGALASYFGWAWVADHRAMFLPGESSHGHYQIELACNTCHDPFKGVMQDACIECHGEELQTADDSHPKSKFTDPRNADRVAKLDARVCVTCHVEHRPALTGAMAVTQPIDYCYHCHSDIGTERASHVGLGFETCQDGGCHNFHDNRALTEDFLEAHLKDPDMEAVPRAKFVAVAGQERPSGKALAAAEHDAPAQVGASEEVVHEWAQSAHAHAGVNCGDCHRPEVDGERSAWVERPTHVACKRCHAGPVAGFLAGRHGMRLAQEMSPMTPAMARLPMRADSAKRELGCSSCHGAHDYDRSRAAVDACLGCHADRHSLAYEASPHAALAAAERDGSAPAGSGVTCATCHLPRTASDRDAIPYAVIHNQNDNLRPNEKMLRGVCQHCHGVGFTLDALADRELVERNFAGRPSRHVQSIDMIVRKLAGIEASRAN